MSFWEDLSTPVKGALVVGVVGIIGAILAYMAGQAVDQGNTADAESKLKWAKILTIVGVVLTTLVIIAYVLMMFVLGAAGAMS